MAVRAIDTLLAIKVMNVINGLTATDRQIGVALLEHFNRRTGQCDPSNGRIAALLQISPRTVIRSTKRLERAGFFLKIRHGGHGNRNSYTPNWAQFAAAHESWNQKFSNSRNHRRTNVSPGSRQSSHIDGDSSGIQTSWNNLKNQPQLAGSKEIGPAPCVAGRASKLFKEGTSSSVAARTAAERRWSDALLQRFRTAPITYGEVVDAITPEIRTAATDAELRRAGSGIGYILAALNIGIDR